MILGVCYLFLFFCLFWDGFAEGQVLIWLKIGCFGFVFVHIITGRRLTLASLLLLLVQRIIFSSSYLALHLSGLIFHLKRGPDYILDIQLFSIRILHLLQISFESSIIIFGIRSLVLRLKSSSIKVKSFCFISFMLLFDLIHKIPKEIFMIIWFWFLWWCLSCCFFYIK